VTKWRKLRPAVAKSLEEAGEQLLTFYAFPKAMCKALRTTNSIENLNGSSGVGPRRKPRSPRRKRL
jgi:transposase-like protein